MKGSPDSPMAKRGLESAPITHYQNSNPYALADAAVELKLQGKDLCCISNLFEIMFGFLSRGQNWPQLTRYVTSKFDHMLEN